MNVLVLLGSPRKKGNSETLVNNVLEGMQEKLNFSAEYIYLHGQKDLSPCMGCGGCEKNGMCVIKDDMIEFYDKLDQADIIFMVTPVYFYGPSAQIKIFIDRCQARWSRKYLLKQRIRENDTRMGYLLATAATKGPRVFEACQLIAKSFFDTIDVKYGGQLEVRSVDERGALKKSTDELEKAQEFGREIAEAFS